MVMADDEYDFFASADDENSDYGSLEFDRSHGRKGMRAQDVRLSSTLSRHFRVYALICGLLAVCAAASSLVHEAAPAVIGALESVRGRYIALTAAVLIGLTMLLVIVARTTVPKRASHHGVASGGVLMMLCATLLLILGVVIGILFPSGIVQPAVRDEAPADDITAMEQQIDRIAGDCTSGWQALSSGGLPGINGIEVCVDSRVAFVSFDSAASAALSIAPLESQIAQLSGQSIDMSMDLSEWRVLSGERWMAFGSTDTMTALQERWGGDLSTLPASSGQGR